MGSGLRRLCLLLICLTIGLGGSVRVQRGVAAAGKESSTQAIRAVLDLERFYRRTGATGIGEVVAVVGSGIDVGSPGLQDERGVPRVLDWVDVTGEGQCQLEGPFNVTGSLIKVDGTELTLDGVKAFGGRAWIGKVSRAHVPLLVNDSWIVGIGLGNAETPEILLVDVDGDSKLESSEAVGIYRSSGQYLTFDDRDGCRRTIVYADCELRGGRVSVDLGFDAVGRGTGLAQVAWGAGESSIVGLAPGASLLAVKAVTGDGVTQWDWLASGLEWALNRGARVILVQTVPNSLQAGSSGADKWLRALELSRAKGSIVVVASGDNGPGFGTCRIPGERFVPIVVGGCLISDAGEVLPYPYGSVGASGEGFRGIDFVAPVVGVGGGIINGVLQERRLYGSDVSAAYIAGILTLIDGAAPEAVRRDPMVIARALAETAEGIPGSARIEVGWGLPRAWPAVELLRKNTISDQIRFSYKWMDRVIEDDYVFTGSTIPGYVPVWIDNLSRERLEFSVSSSASWLRLETKRMLLNPVSYVKTYLRSEPDLSEGLYCGEITFVEREMKIPPQRLSVTFIVPNTIGTAKQPLVLERRGGLIERHFFEVPDCTSLLIVESTLVKAGAQVFLYDPNGTLAYSGQSGVNLRLTYPTSGVWQLCWIFGDTGSPVAGGTLGKVYGSGMANIEYRSQSSQACVYAATSDSEGVVIEQQRLLLHKEGVLVLEPGDSELVSIRFAVDREDAGSAAVVTVGGLLDFSSRLDLFRFDPDSKDWVLDFTGQSSSGFGVSQLKPGLYLAQLEFRNESRLCSYLHYELSVLADISSVQPAVGTGGTSLELEYYPSSALLVSHAGSQRVVCIPINSMITNQIVVQVQGTLGTGTIRAFVRSDLAPYSGMVVLGRVGYQLSEGKATVRLPTSHQRVGLMLDRQTILWQR